MSCYGCEFRSKDALSGTKKARACGTLAAHSAASRWSVEHRLRSANATGHRPSVGRPGVGRDGRRAAVLTPTAARSGLHIDALLGGAQGYAERGWPVLPLWWPLPGGACACGRPDCSKPGKHPLTRHGLHDATADPGMIRRWWAHWPQANVGIRTGASSGLLVVDVDGQAGMASLRALRREHGPFPAAWVRTGSEGWHAYLRQPDGQRVPNSVGRLGPGLDVRADGGSIVAPPSHHASGAAIAG